MSRQLSGFFLSLTRGVVGDEAVASYDHGAKDQIVRKLIPTTLTSVAAQSPPK